MDGNLATKLITLLIAVSCRAVLCHGVLRTGLLALSWAVPCQTRSFNRTLRQSTTKRKTQQQQHRKTHRLMQS
jgi:hypothetical protein